MTTTKSASYIPVIASHLAIVEAVDEGITVDDLASLSFTAPKNVGGAVPSDHQNVLHLPGFESLRKRIDREVNAYAGDFIHVDAPNVQWTVVNSWATKTGPNSFIARHHHPFALYSGVYYPPGQDEMTALQLEFDIPILNPFLMGRPGIALRSVPGSLYIWPSTFHHWTDVNSHKDARYSLAFNVFFSGEFNGHTRQLKVESSHIL